MALGSEGKLKDFDQFWNFDKPAETETKFLNLLTEAKNSGDKDYYLQLKTQIARTQGLQREFDKAQQTLDKVEKEITNDTPVAETRYLLERGRVFNSSKQAEKALPIFI